MYLRTKTMFLCEMNILNEWAEAVSHTHLSSTKYMASIVPLPLKSSIYMCISGAIIYAGPLSCGCTTSSVSLKWSVCSSSTNLEVTHASRGRPSLTDAQCPCSYICLCLISETPWQWVKPPGSRRPNKASMGSLVKWKMLWCNKTQLQLPFPPHVHRVVSRDTCRYFTAKTPEFIAATQSTRRNTFSSEVLTVLLTSSVKKHTFQL